MKKCLFFFFAIMAVIFSSCSDDSTNTEFSPASRTCTDSTVYSSLSTQDFNACIYNVVSNIQGTRSCDLNEEKLTEILQPLSKDGKFIIDQIKDDSDLTREEKDSLESLNEAQLAAVSFIVNTIQYNTPKTRIIYSKSSHCLAYAIFGYGLPGIGATVSTLGAITKICLKRTLIACIGGFGAAITVGVAICEYQYCMHH